MALTKCELSKSFLRYRGEIGTVPQVHKIAWSDFEVAAQRPARRVDRQLLLHCLHHIPVTKHMDVRVTNTPGANWRRAQRAVRRTEGRMAALAHPCASRHRCIHAHCPSQILPPRPLFLKAIVDSLFAWICCKLRAFSELPTHMDSLEEQGRE